MLRRIREMLKCQKGFTLVELMAVIAVIGILAAIAIPRFTNAAEDAAAAKVQADLRTIDSAIATHQAINSGTVPTPINLATYFQAGWPTSPNGWTGDTYDVVNDSKTNTPDYRADYNGARSTDSLSVIKGKKVAPASSSTTGS